MASYNIYTMSKKLSIYLREFLEHLEIEKNRSPLTLQNYQFYLGRFIEWFGDKAPEAISSEDVRQYRLWLNRKVDKQGESLKKNTQNYHLIALRSWLKYMTKRDVVVLSAEKIELMKMPDREVSFLEGDDLVRLLQAPLTSQPNRPTKSDTNKGTTEADRIKYRDKAILEMLFSTGMRVSELAGLRRDQVNITKDELSITGKGRKTRVVFISDEAKYWLKKYIEVRGDMNPYLLVSHDKIHAASKQVKATGGKLTEELEPLTTRSIERLVKKYAKAAGITKPVTPHTLRHSYATDLLQNGADIRSVQTMLGHSSITTTQIYTHITDRELHNIHKKFHGKSRQGD